MYLYNVVFFNFFLVERTLKKELQRGSRGIQPPCPAPPPSCPAYPPHPSSSPPSPPPPPHHPPTSPFNTSPSPSPSECLEGLQALPPLLQGPVGQALGYHTCLGSSSPQVGFKFIGSILESEEKIILAVFIFFCQ